MKGCMKDLSNLHDSNRERAAFTIFCVLLFFQNYCCDMETRPILKQFLFLILINHFIVK